MSHDGLKPAKGMHEIFVTTGQQKKGKLVRYNTMQYLSSYWLEVRLDSIDPIQSRERERGTLMIKR